MLAAHGYTTGTSHGWHDDARRHRTILGQRISRIDALPIWRRLRPTNRLVWETDDDIWHVDPSNAGAYWAYGAATLDAADQAIETAHAVTCSTQPLADAIHARHPGARVHVVPNTIDGRALDLQRPRHRQLTIGWAGGDSHQRDLAALASTLRRLQARHPHVRYHTIGTDYRRTLGVRGDYTPWFPQMWDYYSSIDFDIGLAPLVPSLFNRSKSAIKAIEYGMLGIPVVASDEPPYSGYVIHGETGYLVRRDHEWATYLQQLITDAPLREKLGAAAKEHAAEHTIQRTWSRWAEALDNA